MTTFGDVNNIWLDTGFPSFFLSVDFCDWLFSRAKRTNHIVCHVNEILTALGCVNMIWHEFWGDFGFFPFLSVFRLFSEAFSFYCGCLACCFGSQILVFWFDVVSMTYAVMFVSFSGGIFPFPFHSSFLTIWATNIARLYLSRTKEPPVVSTYI